MSLTFRLINNQTTVSIIPVTSNTLVTLISSSTINMTAISSASGMVSINLAPTVSVVATGQDLNFRTRLSL